MAGVGARIHPNWGEDTLKELYSQAQGIADACDFWWNVLTGELPRWDDKDVTELAQIDWPSEMTVSPDGVRGWLSSQQPDIIWSPDQLERVGLIALSIMTHIRYALNAWSRYYFTYEEEEAADWPDANQWLDEWFVLNSRRG